MNVSQLLLILCCGGPALLAWEILTVLLGGFFGLPREKVEEEK